MTVDARPDGAVPGVQALDLSFRLRADAVLPLLDTVQGRVLDIGGGVGAFSALLAAKGLRVTLADVGAESLEIASRRNPGIAVVQADATELPFEAGSFDAVVCMEVLEHVEDDRRALVELRRVLRAGGQLLLTVPNADAVPPLLERLPIGSVHAQDGPERHYRDGYRLGDLLGLLRECGFAIDHASSLGGRGYRFAAGIVSLAHLAYRRLHGQESWTWADVEDDEGGLPLRVYRRVFPGFLSLARLNAAAEGTRGSTLVVAARAGGAGEDAVS